MYNEHPLRNNHHSSPSILSHSVMEVDDFERSRSLFTRPGDIASYDSAGKNGRAVKRHLASLLSLIRFGLTTAYSSCLLLRNGSPYDDGVGLLGSIVITCNFLFRRRLNETELTQSYLWLAKWLCPAYFKVKIAMPQASQNGWPGYT